MSSNEVTDTLFTLATRTDLAITNTGTNNLTGIVLTSCRNHIYSGFSSSLVPPKLLGLQRLSNVDELTLTVYRQGPAVPSA